MKSEETSKKLPEKTCNTVISKKTKLTPKIHKKVLDLLSEGKSKNYVIKQLKISRDTFYRWKRENKDFAETIATGRAYGEALSSERMLALGLGQIKGNVRALELYNKRVYPEEWREMDAVPVNQTINVGNMNVLQQLQDKSFEDTKEYVLDLLDETKEVMGVECDPKDIIDVEFDITDCDSKEET